MVHLFKFAYLDPGTGSMVIQSLIGIIAGVALFGRKAIASLRNHLKGKEEKPAVSTKNETKATK